MSILYTQEMTSNDNNTNTILILNTYVIHTVCKNDMERPGCIYHGNDINVYLGRPWVL